MFGLIVRFMLKEGAAEGFDALAASTLAKVRTEEPDTLVYACHTVDGRPSERIFYELYRDSAAFEAHERQPYVRHFIAERDRYLDDVVVDRLELTGAKGVPGEV